MSSRRFHAVVCGIAKDEDRYVVEWIAYHLAIGFGHIFLYDNMSERPIRTLIRHATLHDKVTLMRWPSIPGENAQLAAYRHFLHTYRDDVEWAAVIDLDEFINLKQDASIAGFLARFPDAAAIAINWRLFGSSGEQRYRPLPMIERFTHASQIGFGPNRHVKTIYRLSNTQEILMHHGVQIAGSVRSASGQEVDSLPHVKPDQRSFDVAQINHYFSRTRDEWAVKNRRGYASGRTRPETVYDDHDRNDVEDRSIQTRLNATRKLMRKIRQPTTWWSVLRPAKTATLR